MSRDGSRQRLHHGVVDPRSRCPLRPVRGHHQLPPAALPQRQRDVDGDRLAVSRDRSRGFTLPPSGCPPLPVPARRARSAAAGPRRRASARQPARPATERSALARPGRALSPRPALRSMSASGVCSPTCRRRALAGRDTRPKCELSLKPQAKAMSVTDGPPSPAHPAAGGSVDTLFPDPTSRSAHARRRSFEAGAASTRGGAYFARNKVRVVEPQRNEALGAGVEGPPVVRPEARGPSRFPRRLASPRAPGQRDRGCGGRRSCGTLPRRNPSRTEGRCNR